MAPPVSVEVVGPAEINVGQTATIVFTVTNLGDSPASGVVLETTLPECAGLHSADPAPEMLDERTLCVRFHDLPPGEQQKLTLQIVPQQAGVFDLATTTRLSAVSQTQLLVRRPELTLCCEAPEAATYGQEVTFKVLVSNRGDGVADEVLVTPTITPADENGGQRPIRIASLGSGRSVELEFVVVACVDSELSAEFVCDCPGVEPASATAAVAVHRPRLQLSVTGPEVFYVRRTGAFEIRVENQGDAAAETLSVAALLPEGLEPLNLPTEASWRPQERAVMWEFPSVAAGAVETFSLQVSAVREGENPLRVVALSNHDFYAEAAQATRVLSRPDLRMTVIDQHDPLEVGDVVEFSLRIENRGTRDAGDVALKALLPEGLEVLDAEGGQSRDGELAFPVIETLAVGEEQMVRFRLVGREPGDQVIRIVLKSESTSQRIVTEECLFFYERKAASTGSAQEPSAQGPHDEQQRERPAA